MSSIFFDLPHLYYLPQYQPVADALDARGVECHFVLYRDSETELLKKEARDLPHTWVQDKSEALRFYQNQNPDWIIFGNGFPAARQIGCPTALLFHSSGTSVKGASLAPELSEIDVRFVAGRGRLPVYRELFPEQKMVTVGFAKLDPMFSDGRESVAIDCTAYGLDPRKKTLLYSPTFYPSSIENMAPDWPADFPHHNIIIKGHDFTFSKKRYRHQRRSLEQWARNDNVALADPAEYSLLPFMARADLMITDASSAIFEFAALDKPVVVCDFVKLRWSYRGLFRFRLKKRLDSTTKPYQNLASHVGSYKALAAEVENHINHPELLSEQRVRHSDEIMGTRDGKCAQRIADYLLQGKEPE